MSICFTNGEKMLFVRFLHDANGRRVSDPVMSLRLDKKTKILVTSIASVLLLILYLFIFGFSSQDAEQSGSISKMITEKCVEFFNSLTGGRWSRDFMESLTVYFEHPVRKLAHFAEYACMGVLLYVIWSQWVSARKRLCLLILSWVFLSAVLDELHQWFVPGRYASLADVLLDTCGGAVGMLLMILVGRIYRFLSS